MGELAYVRRYAPGEEMLLLEVFRSAVRLIASCDYMPEQVEAWAPRNLDLAAWQARIRGLNPFVAVLGGDLVGYADIQPTGYVDHFYVSGHHPRRNIGSLLMMRLLEEAVSLGLSVLTSDVSVTAQPLFAKFGFSVVERRNTQILGVVMPNVLMSCNLESALTCV